MASGGLQLDYRRVIEEEASRNGIKIHYMRKGEEWGRAALRSKQVFVPEPTSFVPFFTGLHEIGHIMSGHHGRDGKPEYVWEYEAFNWALEYCKTREISVPDATINSERDIIAEKAREEVGSGGRSLDPEIIRFIKQGGDDDADVVFVKKSVADDGRVLTH